MIFKKELRPFQRIGADFLANNFRALLADEMGLGKTVQALAAVAHHNFKRVAVVCPASVRSGWKKEINECGLPLSPFHIDSYEALTAGKFPVGAYDALIMDEAHYVKNGESLRTQAVFGNEDGLARRARFLWPTTGTPVMNRPRELFPMLRTMVPHKIPNYLSFEKFAQQFCGAFFDGRALNTKGASNIEELRRILNGFMLRRTVREVMPELPQIILDRVELEMTDAEMAPILEVEMMIQDREQYLSSTKEDYAQLGDLARLRKATGLAKAAKVAAFVDDLIDSGSGKVCVFYHHTAVAHILDEHLGHRMPVCYGGGMSDGAKDAAITTFTDEKGDCEVFLGQNQAAGQGINGLQTASHTMVFAESEWSPEEMKQIMARLRRIGMDMSRPVNCYVPFVPGTIEGAMIATYIRKEQIIDKLMGAPTGGVVSSPDEIASLLGDLI